MQKADIARHIHQLAEISEAQAATLVDWILELLKTTLQGGESGEKEHRLGGHH